MSIPIRLRPIPLWKEKWNSEALKKKAEEPISFARGFRMIAVTDEEKTFPSFVKCRKSGVDLEDIRRRPWPAYTGVDLSSSKRPGNAIFTLRVDPATQRRYPIDIRHGRWRSDETAAQIAEVYRMYRPLVIKVENNAYQEAILDWIKRETGGHDFWTVLEATTTTGGTKAHAEYGLPGLQVEFKNEAWVIPHDHYAQHPVSCPCSWCLWDREMQNHPMAASDDIAMSAWFSRQGAVDYEGYTGSTNVGNLKAR